MTKEEFYVVAEEYHGQVWMHSLPGPMRRAPAYQKLMDAGPVIIPWIIEGFENSLKKTMLDLNFKLYGMTWVLILMDMTGETPIYPKPVCEGKLVAWNVDDTCKAWISWYRRN